MAVSTTHTEKVESKMRQTNQLRNLSFSPLTLSHFLSFYQTWTTDNQPPTHPPLLCVCTVAISKSISCHFSFLPSQFCFLHPAQGDKTCSVVWRSNLCIFFAGIFTISWYQTVLWLRWAKALDGAVVECVNHMIWVSLHSAAGGDVFSQAKPSLLPQRVLYLYIVCPWQEDTTGMKSCILLWCQKCHTLDE